MKKSFAYRVKAKVEERGLEHKGRNCQILRHSKHVKAFREVDVTLDKRLEFMMANLERCPGQYYPWLELISDSEYCRLIGH